MEGATGYVHVAMSNRSFLSETHGLWGGSALAQWCNENTQSRYQVIPGPIDEYPQSVWARKTSMAGSALTYSGGRTLDSRREAASFMEGSIIAFPVE